MIKKIFRLRIYTAIILLILLYSFSIVNAITQFPTIQQNFIIDAANNTEPNFFIRTQTYIKRLNYHINNNFYSRYTFVELYGAWQRLLNKKEENNFEVIMDNEGQAHYEYFGKNGHVDPALAKRVANLKKSLPTKTQVIAIIPPEKDIPDYTSFEQGLPFGYYNERATNYIHELQQKNIAAFDIRKSLTQSSIKPADIFFKTDHHWRVTTAFFAYQHLAHYLQTNYNFPINQAYLDKENWNFLTYKNAFLGSMGRKTGRYYLGTVDDITLIFPKFNTNYEMLMEYNKDTVLHPKGRFEEALLSYVPFQNNLDQFNPYYDKYSSYLSGDYALAHIVNKNSQGPKVLFIKDSIARPVSAFLSTMCSEVWLIDPRYYKASIDGFAKSHDLDYVFIMFLPQDLTSDFFAFGKTAD